MTAEGHRTGTRTFLFSDIEASSRLEQRLGTATWAALRSRHRVLLRAAFIAEGGVEQGTEGDSFFVVFDSAGAALRAAIAAQRALLAEPWPDGGDVRVRMGLHTGEATRADDDYVGIDINRAARIAAAAHGGQVVMSEVTRALIEGSLGPGVDLRDLGIHRLKDFEPIRLYDVVAAGLPSDFPTLRSGGSPLAGLPAQPTTFVGRSREIAEVRSLLESSSLVTLTGPGGTGKTRLAIAAAQAALAEFPGGVAWVGLSPIVDADLVGPAIAGALAVVDEGLRPIMDAVAERIATERVLLVLDNFEQVASAAPLVGALLRRCPALAVLVTSRGLLHLAGEHEYPVGSLPLPDAGRAADPAALASNETVALFVTRAQAVRPDFELNASNADAVVGICTRLDGLPLAIELAAARVRLLPPAAILDRLERSLGLLTGGAQDLPDRQRTLRGAVGWSHDLLEPVARTLFARLAVFAGGCSLTAAETVADPGGELGIDILDGLSALADQSLVRSTEGVGREPRFLMLHVIREFGLEQLAASGEIEAVRDRHLAAFAALAAEAEPELIGSDSGRWLDRLEVEHDNVRVALRWALDSGQLETGLATAGRLWRFWHQRAHLGEGLAMLRELLACPGGAAMSFGRAKAVNGAGGLAYWQNDFPAAQAYYEEHLAIVRALGDRAGVAEALMNLAFMRAVARALADAFPLYEQSAELYRALGDPRGEAAALLGLGMSLSLAGRYDDALDAVKRGVERAKAGDDRFRVASALGVQARIELAIGRSVDASGLAREALALFSEVGDMSGVAMQIWDLAELALGTGRDRRALVLAGASLALRERVAGGAPPELSQT
ncbi:MAG TPA: tetratricopeptide repeat protein, partial [Candidatus Limnocylindrales bacterium]|nr:tetratricopeptide repeat protein [Candidatus Limnocylindrales bacterium]